MPKLNQRDFNDEPVKYVTGKTRCLCFSIGYVKFNEQQ